MDELLENIGGSIEASAENLTTTIGVNVLVEDSERAMQLLRDLLMKPAYPQDKIDLELKQWKSGIARRNDDPGGVARGAGAPKCRGPGAPNSTAMARLTPISSAARIS